MTPTPNTYDTLDLLEADIESWHPRPDETLVGIVLLYDRYEGKFGEVITVLVREPTQEKIWRVWLSSTVLLNEFKRLKPRIGEHVGVRYFGKHDKGYHRYRVWVDRPGAGDCPFLDADPSREEPERSPGSFPFD